VNGVVANITTGSGPAVNGGSKTLREKPRERGSGTSASLCRYQWHKAVAFRYSKRNFKTGFGLVCCSNPAH